MKVDDNHKDGEMEDNPREEANEVEKRKIIVCRSTTMKIKVEDNHKEDEKKKENTHHKTP